MQAKEFLNKIRHIDMMIDCKLEQTSNLRSRLTSINVTMGERVQSSLDPDKFTNTISKIVELEKEINDDIDKLVDLKSIARKAIESLDNDIEKMVLYKRYFENKTFEQISVELNYSWRRIHQFHGDALKKLESLHIIS